MNLKALVLYPQWCLEQLVAAWPWLEYAVAATMFLAGMYFALRMWLIWQEARFFYGKPAEPFRRMWPEQRIWGSEEL